MEVAPLAMQCSERFPGDSRALGQVSLRKHWDAESDAALLTVAHQMIEQCNRLRQRPRIDWSVVCEVTGRNPKSCRERWVNHLRPGVHKGAWTEKEDALICAGMDELGPRWSIITDVLNRECKRTGGGRTDNAVKNRWHSNAYFHRVNNSASLEQVESNRRKMREAFTQAAPYKKSRPTRQGKRHRCESMGKHTGAMRKACAERRWDCKQKLEKNFIETLHTQDSSDASLEMTFHAFADTLNFAHDDGAAADTMLGTPDVHRMMECSHEKTLAPSTAAAHAHVSRAAQECDADANLDERVGGFYSRVLSREELSEKRQIRLASVARSVTLGWFATTHALSRDAPRTRMRETEAS